MAGRENQPAPVKDDKDSTRRGEELVRLIDRSQPVKPGTARRRAPKWLHDLLDIIWDILTR